MILTNTPERVVTSGVLHLGISDHSLVYVVRKVAIKTKSRHRVVNIRSMKNFNVDRFKNELTSLPWSLVDNLENANDRWELWKSMFMNVVDNHAPLKRKRLRNKKSPWINANLKQLFLQRDKLKKLAVVSKNPADWKKFKDARNTCNNKIRQAKTDYYHQYFKTNSGNPKEIWKSINELMSRNAKSDKISHLTCNDRVISDSADLTECFNNHFAEIGLKLRSDEPDELNNCSFGDYLKQADTVFTLDLTTPSAVFKLLSSLQEGKAMGLDEIPAKLLKCAASVISDSLCNLFNCSIATGVFPDDWKIAKVKPLHKGDAKDLLNNYRPISVLSAVSKIFERIVYDQLQAYLNENGLIYDKQLTVWI